MADESSGDLFAIGDSAGRAAFGDHVPLAERLRPTSLEEVVGQRHLVAHGRLLRDLVARCEPASLILWGPPGVGKTTLARILAEHTGALFVELSATTAGVREVRDTAAAAVRRLRHDGRRTLLFVDEIHRFSKTQQDALLPWVEDGSLVVVGATTENPSFQVVAPLLSRCRVLHLEPLAEADLVDVIERALTTPPPRGMDLAGVELELEPGVISGIARAADGDARKALNALELAVRLAARRAKDGRASVDWDTAEQALQRPMPRYGREEHFDQVSALQKSIRNSDPQAAVYWLIRMLESGEDPIYVARRLIRTASEDVGLADPRALEVALAGLRAVQAIGLPEGALALTQAAVYLSVAPKSNALAQAHAKALEAVRQHGSLEVPLHLRNAVTGLMTEAGYGSGYQYAHDTQGGVSAMECLPSELSGRRFYEPTRRGVEQRVSERMAKTERLRTGQRVPAAPTSEPPSE